MALQYDNFQVRRIVVEANFWPPVEEISSSTLSHLFARVNEGDCFETCELRDKGASFDGDSWDYNVEPSTVLLRWFGDRRPDNFFDRVRGILDGTRVVAMDGQAAFFTEQIRVFADVPEGKNRDVGELVKKRLLKGMKPADRDSLPSLVGAGLNLRGATETYIYQGSIDPAVKGDLLTMWAGLNFRPQPEPPQRGPDLDLIERQVKQATEFVATDLLSFSRKLFN
jgi:hypothetical protein